MGLTDATSVIYWLVTTRTKMTTASSKATYCLARRSGTNQLDVPLSFKIFVFKE